MQTELKMVRLKVLALPLNAETIGFVKSLAIPKINKEVIIINGKSNSFLTSGILAILFIYTNVNICKLVKQLHDNELICNIKYNKVLFCQKRSV